MKNLLEKVSRAACMVLLVFAVFGFSGNAIGGGKTKSLIKDALKAAPDSLKKDVTVVDWDGNVLREGSSSYTCFPTPPNLKGEAPMCLDGPWMTWADAWQNKKDFKISSIGTAYMLAGDEGASNTDPYAAGPTEDNQWIEQGPHLMIILPDPSGLSELSTDPHNGGPYVMWKGTPYAHIMVPISE